MKMLRCNGTLDRGISRLRISRPRIFRLRIPGLRAVGLLLGLPAALTACAPEAPQQPVPSAGADLPYAVEYPGVGYGRNEPRGVLGRLAAAVAAGDAALPFTAERGYLDAALEALAIDASSQVLVFSRTSLQTRQIRPHTPRAIYFNDETYVAWVPDAPSLELSGYDPELGPVFYRMLQAADQPPALERQFGVCLRCHDTYGLSGDGVPRFLLGSGYTGTDGELVSHEAWILTSQATPLRIRWGGWYVTGGHGSQEHLGNIVVERAEDLQDLESLRVGNLTALDGLFDTSRYLTPYSDIVALMVLEHQVEVQNLISRLRFEAESAEAAPLGPHVDALIRALLLIDAAALTEPLTGSSGFAEHFESLGPFDTAGRSLRELDLQTRLFRYPLSYLIYSEGFQALPLEARQAVYAGLRGILAGGAPPGETVGLADSDREAITAILRETLPAAGL